MRAWHTVLLFVILTGALLFAWPRWVRQLMRGGEHLGASIAWLFDSAAPVARGPQLERAPPPFEPSVANDANPAEPRDALGFRRGARREAKKPVPQSIHVPAETVLRWIEMRHAPNARPVVASGSRPRGVLLSGVAPFAAGVEDGDVLFAVNGTPIASRDDVVLSVLSAQSMRSKAISAQFWRSGEVYRLTVELPYLDSAGKLQHDYGNVANGQLH